MCSSKENNFNGSKELKNKGRSNHVLRFGFIEWFSDRLIQIIFSCLLLILALIGILLVFPFSIYRICVKYCAKVFRKDLGDMLSPRSSTFAVDKITTSPKFNVIFSIVLEGDLDLKNFRSEFESRVTKNNPKDSKGNDRYKKLFQYVVNWGGYFFWKDDKSFDLSNHINSLPDNIGHTEKDLMALNQTYLGRKWPNKRPLWKFVLVPNYTPSHSTSSGPHVALLGVFHHSISDAYSFFYFIINALGQKERHSNAVPKYISRRWYSMILYILTFPLVAAWETARIGVDALKSNELYAHRPIDIFQLNGPQGANYNLGTTQSLPISLIKDVKSHYNTTFGAVQLSVISGAITEFYKGKGISLPRVTPCLAVLAYPGHKLDKFQNHATGDVISLPTSETDPIKLLHLITEEYNRCKSSTIPTACFYAWGLSGYLVSPIVRFGLRIRSVPTAVSSIPAGLEYANILQCKIVDCFGFAGMLDNFGGIYFVPVSYVDRFRISFSGKPSKFSSDDLKSISNLVEKRFISLAKQIQCEP